MINAFKKQAGLSLIELMIAILIGLFLTAGLIELFTHSKQTYRVQDELSRLQENARFAMQTISRDLRMADFAGCRSNSLADAKNSIDVDHEHFNTNTDSVSSGLGGENGAAGASPALDSPDTLTIVNAFNTGLTVLDHGPLASDNITIGDGNSLEQGDIVLIADCEKADIFQVFNDPSTDNFITHVLGNFSHGDDPVEDEPGNINAVDVCPPNPNPALNHCLSDTYQASATIYKLITNTYTIDDGANGQSALFKNGGELIEGIENLQVLYGEDTTPLDSNINPDYYVPAGTAGLNMDNVISVRVSILAVTAQDNLSTQAIPYTFNGETIIPADNRIRRVFTSTVNLRNRRL